jgi:thiol-disulfide isomerase/thioredoxin
MPSLEELERSYQDKNLKILQINVGEAKEAITSFFQGKSYSFTVLLDSYGEVSRIYSVFGHPAAFLIDKQGNVVFRSIGYRDWNTEKIRGIFDRVIEE